MAELNRSNSDKRIWQTADDIRASNLSLRWGTQLAILRSIFLLGLDAAMVYLSWVCADRLGTPTAGAHIANSLLPILGVTVGTLAASGFYGSDDKLHRFARLFKTLTIAQAIILMAAFFYLPKFWWVSRSVFLIAWLLNLLFVGVSRLLFDFASVELRKYPAFREPIVLLGNRADMEKVKTFLARAPQFRVKSRIDLTDWNMQTQFEDILALIRSQNVSEVFVCSKQLIDSQILFYWHLKAAGIHLRMVPTELSLPQRVAETKMIDELPTIRYNSLAIFGINFWIKRLFDIIAASVILVLISPLLIGTAIAIATTSPGPIFYKQPRVGLKGRRFQMWKFRSMVANANELQQELEQQNEVQGGVLFKIKDDPRITKVGKFLRDYSIDELPQLINVLQGNMSLVGPRPLSIRDYEMSLHNLDDSSHVGGASPLENRFLRYEVLPGITGLWQVRGRASGDSNQIFYWDMVYILQWSLALDLKILLQTIKVVLNKEGSC